MGKSIIAQVNNGVTFRWIAGVLAAALLMIFGWTGASLAKTTSEQGQALQRLQIDVAMLKTYAERQEKLNVSIDEKVEQILKTCPPLPSPKSLP